MLFVMFMTFTCQVSMTKKILSTTTTNTVVVVEVVVVEVVVVEVVVVVEQPDLFP